MKLETLRKAGFPLQLAAEVQTMWVLPTGLGDEAILTIARKHENMH